MANCEKCKLEIKSEWAYCPYCGNANHLEIITPNKRPENIIHKKKINITYFEKMEKIKTECPKAYQPWTKQEDEQLTQMYNKGKKIKEIAITLQRQIGGIRSRLKQKGLIKQKII